MDTIKLSPDLDPPEVIPPLMRLVGQIVIRFKGVCPREGMEGTLWQILRYVQNHYAEQLKAEDICRRFGCSRSYLSHTFKKETGKGFREYLTAVRVEQAKRLLQYATLNVTEVARSVGFDDANYFSSVFKKETGTSPLAYRKRNA